MSTSRLAPELSLTENELDSLSAPELIRWAHAEFGERLCLTCSWQKQSSVLVHMVAAELELEMDVVELDTHLFFRESYETRERLVERYGLSLIRPEIITVARQHASEGPNLWETDPDRCCHVRKVEPLITALRALRCVDLGDPARPVPEPGRYSEGHLVRALRRLEDPSARGLGRVGRLGLRHGQRHPVQPAARRRLPVDRLHSLHPPDPAGRGGAGGALGRLRQARVRDPRRRLRSACCKRLSRSAPQRHKGRR